MPLLPFLLLALAAQPAAPGLCDRLTALTLEPAVARAHWGVSVTTMDGSVVCAIDDARYFRPASNAKLFTTAAALALLGPDATVVTRIAGAEPVDGVVAGDLTIVGAGDAYLSVRPMPYTTHPGPTHPGPATPADPMAALADALVARGVRHVTGDVVGDDSAFPYEPYPPDWALDDLVWGYGAPISALTVADNKTALTVTPGAQPGMPATATLNPPDPLLRLDTQVATVAARSQAGVRVDRDPGSRIVRVAGTVAQGEPYIDDLAIDHPAEYAANLLKTLLADRGVQVDGTVRVAHALPRSAESFSHEAARPLPELPLRPVAAAVAETRPALASHTSPTLADDVTVTLKVSQNLHAELLLHRLALRWGDDGSGAEGVRVLRQYLLNSGVLKAGEMPEVVLFDGSGMSGHDLATPRAITRLLTFAARQSWYPVFHAALPVSGVDGSLAGRLQALTGRVAAKTGTLGESRALSGYVETAGGETLAFSILVDNHAPQGNADRVVMDRMVEAIAGQARR